MAKKKKVIARSQRQKPVTAQLTKKYLLSCMHQLYSEKLSPAQNQKIFGKCCNMHGHDYRVEVTFQGEIDPVSGLSVDRDLVDHKIQKEFVKKYHKSNLNLFFKSTTGEDLAREFFGELTKLFKKDKAIQIVRVRLQETPKNHFTWGEF